MGYYYLHSETKDLIWKRYRINSEDSDFVVKSWEFSFGREDAWVIILESLALGADKQRIEELCRKWKCDVADFREFIRRTKTPTPLMQEGAILFLERIAGVNVDAFWKEPF